MKCNVIEKSKSLYEDTYLLDKKICEKYNMKITKENVLELIGDLKESRLKNIAMLYDYGLVSNLENSISKNGLSKGFSNKIDNLIDKQSDFLYQYEKMEIVKSSFTETESSYYTTCLQNCKSEDYLLEQLDEMSKTGLSPIKNSCILKIALAFDLAVLKDE